MHQGGESHCLSQEHNTMSPVGAQPKTTQCGVNSVNQETITTHMAILLGNTKLLVPLCLKLVSTITLWVSSIMPEIPEILVRIQMERSVSVSSDRKYNWDHIWSWCTYFG